MANPRAQVSVVAAPSAIRPRMYRPLSRRAAQFTPSVASSAKKGPAFSSLRMPQLTTRTIPTTTPMTKMPTAAMTMLSTMGGSP